MVQKRELAHSTTCIPGKENMQKETKLKMQTTEQKEGIVWHIWMWIVIAACSHWLIKNRIISSTTAPHSFIHHRRRRHRLNSRWADSHHCELRRTCPWKPHPNTRRWQQTRERGRSRPPIREKLHCRSLDDGYHHHHGLPPLPSLWPCMRMYLSPGLVCPRSAQPLSLLIVLPLNCQFLSSLSSTVLNI